MTALAAESPESQTPAGTLASAHAAATTELCVHCGLEVPAGLRRGLGVRRWLHRGKLLLEDNAPGLRARLLLGAS